MVAIFPKAGSGFKNRFKENESVNNLPLSFGGPSPTV